MGKEKKRVPKRVRQPGTKILTVNDLAKILHPRNIFDQLMFLARAKERVDKNEK